MALVSKAKKMHIKVKTHRIRKALEKTERSPHRVLGPLGQAVITSPQRKMRIESACGIELTL